MKNLFFMTDRALEVKDKISKGIFPKHMLYGGYELENERKAKVEDYLRENIILKKRGDIVVTNRLKYVPLMKRKGIKIILVNMNSNHDLAKYPGMKNKLKRYFNMAHYLLCDRIVCLSEIQLSRLRAIGVPKRKLKVIPLGVDKELIDNVKKSKEYFLSSGFDKGKDHGFVKNALEGFNVKILDGKTPLPYREYLKVLGKAKAIVLNLDISKRESSDLSGTTTSFESLLMKKPIFVNEQPWLKELYKENYYVYKDKTHLRELISKEIKFKELDYSYLTLDNFRKELNKIIFELSK